MEKIQKLKSLHTVCVRNFCRIEKIKLRVKSQKEKSRQSEDTRKQEDHGELSTEVKENQEAKELRQCRSKMVNDGTQSRTEMTLNPLL